jgi:hypothetical protein
VQSTASTRRATAAPRAEALSPAAAVAGQPPHRPHLETVAAGHPDRPALEQLVAETYATKHGARITGFLPTFLALRSPLGSLRATAGLRPAAGGELFLEQYLDGPVEAALGRAAGATIARSRIAEIGNLAARECRSACKLALLLPERLARDGHDWVVFTATDVVRALITGLGTPLVELAAATPDRLRSPRDDWGRYYERSPRVVAAWLPAGGALTRHGLRRQRAGR